MIRTGTEHDYDGNLLSFSLPHNLRQSRIYLIFSAGCTLLCSRQRR